MIGECINITIVSNYYYLEIKKHKPILKILRLILR